PGIELAGATTAGEMSSVIGFSEDSVALALFATDSVEITAGIGGDLFADPAGATGGAVAKARAKATQPPRLCLVMPTIGGAEAGAIFDGLRAALGPGVPIIGGGASPEDPAAPLGTTQSRQFTNDEISHDSIAILLFSGDLDFSFGVETGWQGVGPLGVVTKTSPEGVLEIDGRPAIAFYSRYLGTGQPPIANPLAVFEGGGSDRFYLRTPINWDPETGRVGFFGDVPDGATVQITVAGTEQIFEGARASMQDALASFPAGKTPEAALVYSCATRRFLLGTRVGREFEMVRDLLGTSIPIAGMYCLGEIAPMSAPDRTQFHNATLVSVLLGAS
ncbi:MAG TPA: FIST C-terminal domain-containing protein, partial [Solirubrobacterales bacterium]|nr:FIST C-terminal domain-containing protein [Solirubrobacterales bacterium]